MTQQSNNDNDQEMLGEYDFSEGVRGKYIGRFAQGANVVVFDPTSLKSSLTRNQ